MSRISISDDEDFPGQWGLWEGNCRRQIRGKAGQAALRRLEAALLALPERRLISRDLVNSEGVCAFGALAMHDGKLKEAQEIADHEYMEDVGESLGVPRLLSWRVVYENDESNNWEYVTAEGPTKGSWDAMYPEHYQNRGVSVRVPVTPEQRYERVLAWVRENLVADGNQSSDAKRAVTPAASEAQK